MDSELTVSPALARPCAAAWATSMAPSAPSSGKIHSSGLRYTTKNTAATISTAVSSRVFCVPLPLSALTAADPVTSACSPSPACRAAVAVAPRIAFTALVSRLVRVSSGAVIWAVNTAALPSADRRAAPGGCSPLTRQASRVTAAWAEATAARSAAVRPCPRTNTTATVSVSGRPGPRCAASCSSATRVDCAEAGR